MRLAVAASGMWGLAGMLTAIWINRVIAFAVATFLLIMRELWCSRQCTCCGHIYNGKAPPVCTMCGRFT